jgi:hypothetical protein
MRRLHHPVSAGAPLLPNDIAAKAFRHPGATAHSYLLHCRQTVCRCIAAAAPAFCVKDAESKAMQRLGMTPTKVLGVLKHAVKGEGSQFVTRNDALTAWGLLIAQHRRCVRGVGRHLAGGGSRCVLVAALSLLTPMPWP